jgi:hypothetical protein
MTLLHTCEILQHGNLDEVEPNYREIVEERWMKLIDAILLFKNKDGADITLDTLDENL